MEYLRFLNEIVASSTHKTFNLEDTLKEGLLNIIEIFKFDRVDLFLLERELNILRSRVMVTKRGILEGEWALPLGELSDSPLLQIVRGEKKYLIVKSEMNFVGYVPVVCGREIIGLFRIDNWASKKEITPDIVHNLLRYANEFGIGIWAVNLWKRYQHKATMALALAEVSSAMITTVSVSRILEKILHNVIDILGFDRAKLYLVSSRGMLENVMSLDLRGKIYQPQKKSIPLESGTDRAVDVLLGDDSYFKQGYISSHLQAFMPLRVKTRTVGLLAVDNVFSREVITPEKKELLDVFANQAAVAIENTRLIERIKEISITDGLTNLYVHDFFQQRLGEELSRAERFGDVLSIMIIDVDNFKHYNDTYGHLMGDIALKFLAEQVKDNIRQIDFAARYGGDEVVVILPGSSLSQSKNIAERIWRAVRNNEVGGGIKGKKITVCIGVATYPICGKTKRELIRRADAALYWAKTHGKDMICIDPDLQHRENKKEIKYRHCKSRIKKRQ